MENTIMNMEPKRERIGFSKHETQKLHHFLMLSAGNWRNAVYVDCLHGGYLLTFDRDALPYLISVELFYDMTSILPERDEMVGVLSADAFNRIFRQWRLWNTDADGECGVCRMHERMGGDEAD